MSSIERQAARYVCDVADAIAAVNTGKTTYGEFYVTEVRFGFDGEDSGFRVIPNEFGDYDIATTPATETDESATSQEDA